MGDAAAAQGERLLLGAAPFDSDGVQMKITMQTLTAFAADVFMCAALCGVITYEGAKLAPHSASVQSGQRAPSCAHLCDRTRGVIQRYTCYTIGRNLLEAYVGLPFFSC